MLEFAKKLAKRGGKLALGYYKKGVKAKTKSTPDDLVTVADGAVSDFIIQEIKKKFPSHGIISEEEDEPYNPDAEYVWVIDPIDGTRNFARHMSSWCTMVGLEKNSKPYIGVIYDAVQDELFFAEKGKGAFCNDKKIRVSDSEDTDYCFLFYAGGVNDAASPYSSDKFLEYKNFYNNLISNKGRWIHKLGSALEACYVSAGRADAILTNGLLYHDCLASYVIATEAGALYTDCRGLDWKKGMMDIVVANPKLHKKLLKLFYAK